MGLKTYASMTEPAEVDGGDGAHSDVGEAPVHKRRKPMLTMPAVQSIIRVPASPALERPESVYPIVRVTRQQVLWGGAAVGILYISSRNRHDHTLLVTRIQLYNTCRFLFP